MDFHTRLIEHVPRLRRHARALLNHRERADDLVQETLDRAVSHAKAFRHGIDFRVWLFTIMHDAFADCANRSSQEDLDRIEMSMTNTLHGSLEVRDLDYALQRLTNTQREVVLLAGLEDMSHSEIATALNTSLAVVRSRLSHGRERMRVLMSDARPQARLKVVR